MLELLKPGTGAQTQPDVFRNGNCQLMMPTPAVPLTPCVSLRFQPCTRGQIQPIRRSINLKS